MSETLAEPTTVAPPTPQLQEPGDSEKFAHYVDKGELNEGIVMQTPVTALCGKTWVPTRDPEKFPVCPECKEIWEGTPVDEDNPGWSGI